MTRSRLVSRSRFRPPSVSGSTAPNSPHACQGLGRVLESLNTAAYGASPGASAPPPPPAPPCACTASVPSRGHCRARMHAPADRGRSYDHGGPLGGLSWGSRPELGPPGHHMRHAQAHLTARSHGYAGGWKDHLAIRSQSPIHAAKGPGVARALPICSRPG